MLSRVQVGILSVASIAGGVYALWKASFSEKIDSPKLRFWVSLPASLLIACGLLALFMSIFRASL